MAKSLIVARGLVTPHNFFWTIDFFVAFAALSSSLFPFCHFVALIAPDALPQESFVDAGIILAVLYDIKVTGLIVAAPVGDCLSPYWLSIYARRVLALNHSPVINRAVRHNSWYLLSGDQMHFVTFQTFKSGKLVVSFLLVSARHANVLLAVLFFTTVVAICLVDFI